MDKKLRETTNLCVEIMNCKTTSKEETWSRGTKSHLPFDVHVTFNHSDLSISGDTSPSGPNAPLVQLITFT